MGIEELPKFNPVSNIQKGEINKITSNTSPLTLPSSSRVRAELNGDIGANVDIKSAMKKVKDALMDGSGRNIPPGTTQSLLLTSTRSEAFVPASKMLVETLGKSEQKYSLANIIGALLSLVTSKNLNDDKN